MDKHHEYMQMAIAEALEGIRQGHGGPFGCVIVKDGEVVAKGHNRVLKNHDATAHGEITAIREAFMAARSTLPVNPATCAFVPSSGPTSAKCITDAPSPTTPA